MENIFFFIVIMIISSILSGKKKKKAAERQQEKTTFYGSDRKPSGTTGPVTDLKDLLDRLKNNEEPEIEPEHYDVADQEVLTEDNPYDEISQNGEAFYAPQEDIENPVVRKIAEPVAATKHEKDRDEAYTVKKRESRFSKLLDSRTKLRQAVIISEILNRKYT